MDPRQPNDPRQLKLSNQVRFLLYLHWLRFQERLKHFLIGLFFSPRAQVHWLGSRRRPRRLERPAILLLFMCAIILLEPREYAIWAAIFGGFAAMTVPFISLRYILRAHWIK